MLLLIGLFAQLFNFQWFLPYIHNLSQVIHNLRDEYYVYVKSIGITFAYHAGDNVIALWTD